ncbi:PCRF domain-containing protein [endosymbiont GvMRE of Glomus versiforme]|uniref:PCRF domain-containing protein n=1 Tax=endosymbiont GvMRE of Glomus versiforme TaxID=2039283 RepID=UPI000EE46D87|nr:PCRF domain-containing protein [endosymbiont GvMRE of Glomus versiforme]RHZ35393.1 Peptide chain release factor 1 [endosymbiont GvMRE of Glomus versiforme]
MNKKLEKKIIDLRNDRSMIYKNELVKKIIIYLEKLELDRETSPLKVSDKKKKNLLLSSKKEYEKLEQTQKDYQELVPELSKEEQVWMLAEIKNLEKQKERIINKIKEELIEEGGVKQNVIVEIRPGAGGEEAGLFVRDLYGMYEKFVKKMGKKNGWEFEEIENEVDSKGNSKFVSFWVRGKNAFSWLKNEAGVHRVQRVPRTEKSGRVHTSTASVVVLPESQDRKILIQDKDVKREFYGSGGPGGQHANKTASAVTLTHIPTGITASCRSDRRQQENEKQARLVLESRIQDKYRREEETKARNTRSSMIGKADRSEAIRTYNEQQNRLTDDRLRMSWKKLNFIIEGELEEICQKLIDYEVEKFLQ